MHLNLLLLAKHVYCLILQATRCPHLLSRPQPTHQLDLAPKKLHSNMLTSLCLALLYLVSSSQAWQVSGRTQHAWGRALRALAFQQGSQLLGCLPLSLPLRHLQRMRTKSPSTQSLRSRSLSIVNATVLLCCACFVQYFA